MAEVSKETGTLAVLAKRMVEERLPKALAMKERIDKGGVLNDLDLAFLEQIVKDWIATAKHPKTRKRYTEMVYQPMLELLDYLRAMPGLRDSLELWATGRPTIRSFSPPM